RCRRWARRTRVRLEIRCGLGHPLRRQPRIEIERSTAVGADARLAVLGRAHDRREASGRSRARRSLDHSVERRRRLGLVANAATRELGAPSQVVAQDAVDGAHAVLPPDLLALLVGTPGVRCRPRTRGSGAWRLVTTLARAARARRRRSARTGARCLRRTEAPTGAKNGWERAEIRGNRCRTASPRGEGAPPNSVQREGGRG